MSQVWITILLAVSDFVAINLATVALLWMKHAGGSLRSVAYAWNQLHPDLTSPPFVFVLEYYLWDALPLIYLCWLVLLVFNGLYRPKHTPSRLDEGIAVLKVITVGVLLLFIATFDLQEGMTFTRALVGSYWLALVVLVAGGRAVLRTLQRRLLTSGIGRNNAIIVGTDERGARLLQDLLTSPAQGYEVIGFARAPGDAEVDTVEG
ncbi:MAG: hypothetical protein QF689_05810, partial [Candidatus Latescibacteria bacterium]|nr:hypothetical protein [Candidatus Latescibacterota bacterium]